MHHTIDMNYGVIRKYRKKEIIYREGEKANAMYEIRWGSVGLYSDYGTENEKHLLTLDEDGCIGAFAILDNSGYKVTAVSLTRGTQLEEISKEDFYDFFSSKPSKLLSITQSFCRLHKSVLNNYVAACKRVAELEKVTAEKGDVENGN